MIRLAILLVVIGVIGTGMMQIMNVQGAIKNRTEMHTSVRNATELMQQEIGQAGKISLPGLPGSVTLTAAVGATTATVSSTQGMFANMFLDVDTGANYEFVQVSSVGTNSITIAGPPAPPFAFTHSSAPVGVSGGFATGIVPCAVAGSNYCPNGTSYGPTGSTGTVLKLYGDLNGDGNMHYVEYTCAPGTVSAPGFLYRNDMSFTASPKPAIGPPMVLVSNLLPNPNNTPCFQYQTAMGNAGTYVVDVAVTLTVQTQLQDQQTHQFQTETKALLNISPRNVFEVWQWDAAKHQEKVQPMPASVAALLP